MADVVPSKTPRPDDRRLRIFLASPGDVAQERRATLDLLTELERQFGPNFEFDTFDWDRKAFGSDRSFQSAIPETGSYDLVIAILWSRLGSPDTALPTMDQALPGLKASGEEIGFGEAFPSCSAFELLTALDAGVNGNGPTVLTFRRTDPPKRRSDIDDADGAARETREWLGVDRFFRRWFHAPDGSIRRAYRSYGETAGMPPLQEFRRLLRNSLRDWVETKSGLKRNRLPDGASPFKGLEHYEYRDHAVFFGRDRKIDRAIEMFAGAVSDLQTDASPAQAKAILLISGVSGSGKSSLMRAGVAPRVTLGSAGEGRSQHWRIAVMRPGGEDGGPNGGPFASLARALLVTGSAQDDPGGFGSALPELLEPTHPGIDETRPFDSVDHLAATLARAEVRQIHALLARLSHDKPVPVRLLLLVDQLEELFVNDGGRNAGAFARLIEALASQRVYVVATLRADHYGSMISREMIALKDRSVTYDLAPPGPDEIDEILTESASAAGFVYESVAGVHEDEPLEKILARTVEPVDAGGQDAPVARLDRFLMRESRERDVLPLLQFALQRMFDRMQDEGGPDIMRFRHYEQIGRLDGAIQESTELAFASVDPSAQECLPDLLRDLVDLGVSGQERRSQAAVFWTLRVTRAESCAPTPASQRLLAALVQNRIVRVLGDRGREGPAQLGDVILVRGPVQFAHERVTVAWQRAAAILQESATILKDRAAIEGLMRTWADRDRAREYLLPSGRLLATARDMRRRSVLGKDLGHYIDLSLRRGGRRQRLIALSTAVLVSVLTLLLVFAVQESLRAKRGLNVALGSLDNLTEEMAFQLEDLDGFDPAAKIVVLDRIDGLINRLDGDLQQTGQSEPFTYLGRWMQLPQIGLFAGEDSEVQRIRDLRASVLFARGTTLREARQFDEATAPIAETLGLRRQAVEDDPDDPLRGSRLADALELSGDHARFREPLTALENYSAALRLREALLEGFPTHPLATTWKVGRSTLQSRIGDTQFKNLDEPEKALKAYQNALSLSLAGASAAPTDLIWLNELGWNLKKIGDFLSSTMTGNDAETLRALEGSVCIRRLLTRMTPEFVERARDLSFANESLAKHYLKMDQPHLAVVPFEDSLVLRMDAFGSMDANREYARDLLHAHVFLFGLTQAGVRDKGLAVTHALLAADLVKSDPQLLKGSDSAVRLGEFDVMGRWVANELGLPIGATAGTDFLVRQDVRLNAERYREGYLQMISNTRRRLEAEQMNPDAKSADACIARFGRDLSSR